MRGFLSPMQMLWSSAGPFAASASASVFSTLEPDPEAAAGVSARVR